MLEGIGRMPTISGEPKLRTCSSLASAWPCGPEHQTMPQDFRPHMTPGTAALAGL
jgi:hypothetical protein